MDIPIVGHMEHGCYILHSTIRLVKSHFYGLSFSVPVRLCCRRLTGGTGVLWLQPGDKFSHSAAFFQQQRAKQLAAPEPPCLCRNACGREKNAGAWQQKHDCWSCSSGEASLGCSFSHSYRPCMRLWAPCPQQREVGFEQWADFLTKNMQRKRLAEFTSLLGLFSWQTEQFVQSLLWGEAERHGAV